MAPLTRRRKAALDAAAPAIDPADRLSKLPVEILAHIVSLLPAEEAVQTCVLGRTWRDVWKIAPRLLITGGYFIHQVREFLDHLLRVRLDGCAPLDVCEFVFNGVDGGSVDDGTNVDEDTFSVNSWIRRVLKCQVQTLRVNTWGYIPGAGYLDLSESPFVSPHLTRLEFRGVAFEDWCLNLSGCPLLEHLEMGYCCLPGVVTCPSLKRLVIASCIAGSDSDRVRFCVPRLVSLWLESEADYDKWVPQLQSMPDLVRAHVEISSSSDLFDSDDAMCKLLQGLAEAKVLEMKVDSLSTSVLNAIFQRDLRLCPIFSKLKTLVLSENEYSEPKDCTLACILERAPFLEKLTLKFYRRMKYRGSYKAEVKGHLDEHVKSTQRLKIVEVKCESVDQRVLKLLNFFWYT